MEDAFTLQMDWRLTDEWSVASASLRSNGYPFVHLQLRHVEEAGREAAVRLDLGKRAIIDLLPDAQPLEVAKKVLEELSDWLRANPVVDDVLGAPLERAELRVRRVGQSEVHELTWEGSGTRVALAGREADLEPEAPASSAASTA